MGPEKKYVLQISSRDSRLLSILAIFLCCLSNSFWWFCILASFASNASSNFLVLGHSFLTQIHVLQSYNKTLSQHNILFLSSAARKGEILLAQDPSYTEFRHSSSSTILQMTTQFEGSWLTENLGCCLPRK